MPKAKRHSGAKKRFKLTGTGKLTRKHAMQSHNLEKKSQKRKRAFGNDQQVDESNAKAVLKLLGRK